MISSLYYASVIQGPFESIGQPLKDARVAHDAGAIGLAQMGGDDAHLPDGDPRLLVKWEDWLGVEWLRHAATSRPA